jgi:hypothetical protein
MSRNASGATHAPTGEAETAALEVECSALARHVASVEPPAGLLDAYVRAHRPGMNGPCRTVDDEDDALVRFARRGPITARLADTFATAFDPEGPLRRKIALVAALLETGAGGELLERPRSFGTGSLAARAVRHAVVSVAWWLAALVAVGPVWLLFRHSGDDAGDAPP